MLRWMIRVSIRNLKKHECMFGGAASCGVGCVAWLRCERFSVLSYGHMSVVSAVGGVDVVLWVLWVLCGECHA